MGDTGETFAHQWRLGLFRFSHTSQRFNSLSLLSLNAAQADFVYLKKSTALCLMKLTTHTRIGAPGLGFPNARRIQQRMGVSVSTFKALALAASSSRPALRSPCMLFLRFFIRQDQIVIHYPCRGRKYQVGIRVADLDSDWQSLNEVAIREEYRLETSFAPDLVIDGGGNIGIFSLLASAAFPDAKIVVCEPVPGNLTQIHRHLQANAVRAEVLPVCLGGAERTIPFYLREANQGSFGGEKPFTSQIDVEVTTLASILRTRDASRIVIKLDIEGMEIEVLESFVPHETRPVFVTGELHGHKANHARMRQIFEGSGWHVQFERVADQSSVFEAWSPAAASFFGPIAASSLVGANHPA